LKNVHSDLLFNEYLRVSSDTDISDDEEDEQDNSSYDSFIDDRINPTAASSPAESCGNDMMAIYRCFSLSLSLSLSLSVKHVFVGVTSLVGGGKGDCILRNTKVSNSYELINLLNLDSMENTTNA
jgi:hypothetical protein